ncbi:hypothetical protein BCV72DRAFT_254249 [Rhizopus microsporus var. microsporus]|uniref:Homeodomain-like DNA binding domain-containing transcription factor n=1 Tax=Rhizopus microsporus var. microsporus TaxID=86635 RepID=A0A1X0REY3_RHIZD|nr:hypothetical protein BCV72DRAFT_254249 [Rhizopus microsporus var. microsporus]
MSFQIFYEGVHSNAVDEYGRPEPMDYIIDEERYALETVSSHTQHLHNKPQENNIDVGSMADEDAKDDPDVCMKEASSKRAYTLYTDQDKVRFFKLMFEKVMSASAAAKQLGIHICTAQRWTQIVFFIKHKKTGRSRILHEEHKQVILEYIDENPSAVLEQVMERLLQKLQDLKVSKSTVYNFVRTECNLSFKASWESDASARSVVFQTHDRINESDILRLRSVYKRVQSDHEQQLIYIKLCIQQQFKAEA